MILAFIKMMNKPMTDKEIEKWLAEDEERIRKYIEKKEAERKANKEEDRWGA
jgi:arsenate reductase-like glutaredoxin family protein